MSTGSPPIPKQSTGRGFFFPDIANRPERLVFVTGLRGAALVAGGLSLVGIIALLDFGTGPYLSFGIFYLIPVALCAWWCGFAHGIIIALGGALAWHIVDSIENP